MTDEQRVAEIYRHMTHTEQRSGTYVLRCLCGWESEPASHPAALGNTCQAKFEEEMRRTYAVVRLRSGDCYYRLQDNGLALRVATRGIVASPGAYVVDDAEAPLRLALEDGRSFLVVLHTCDQCGESYEIGENDSHGHGFCGADCRRAYWETH